MNILLISVDSLRADHVGFHNQKHRALTPTLNDLAADSLQFSRAFSNGPYTRISFPSILTGTYAWMYGGIEMMSEQRPMLASSLRDAGYSTAGFHSNPYLKAEFNYDRGFQQYNDGENERSTLASLREFVVNNFSEDSMIYRLLRTVYTQVERSTGIELGTPYAMGNTITDQAIRWLESAPSPAFLWIHYMDVHHPYIPHEGTVSEHISPREAVSLRQTMLEEPNTLSTDDIEKLRVLYKGEIQYVENCISRLLRAVNQTQGLDETSVVFLSDHGESFGEHGHFGHPPEFTDELLRIPLIVYTPDGVSDKVDVPVSAIDVMPTILDIADCSIPDKSEGDSLRTLALDPPSDRIVFAHTGVREDGTVMATNSRMKLIHELSDSSETAYIREDNGEQEVAIEDCPEQLLKTLRTAIRNHIDHIDAHRGTHTSKAELPDKTKERLKQLGYRE